MNSPLAIVLAAGKGTRMETDLPKVLVPALGRPMIEYVLESLHGAGIQRALVVVGYRSDEVRRVLTGPPVRQFPQITFVEQTEQLGTGHAVLAAAEALADFDGEVLVTNADCPLLEGKDLEPLFALRAQGVGLALLGFEPADAALYGRLIRGADGHVLRIVEARDASEEERHVKACYSGMMAADRAQLFGWLTRQRQRQGRVLSDRGGRHRRLRRGPGPRRLLPRKRGDGRRFSGPAGGGRGHLPATASPSFSE